jgi:tricorn protease
MNRPAFKYAPLALASALLALGTQAALAGQTGFYRQPALRGDRLVFVAEGDLWQANVGGGTAQRVTTHSGAETFPALSPDGRWIAFVGQQETAGDVFVMPAGGGVARRLTWDTGAVRVWGITADNEVLYSGATERGEPGTQLHLVSLVSGVHRALPVGQASDGALSPDGKTLYFTRNGLRGDNARQYRGGALARLWVMDLAGTAEAKPLLPEGANDRRPMPYQDASGTARVAFLSDRDGTYNLWSVKADGSDLRQHTRHKGWDVRHASLDGAQAVYALGADLYRLDLNSSSSGSGSAAEQKIDLHLAGDYDQQRKRWIARPQDFLTGVSLSPNGEQVVLTARGRLATQGVGPLRRAELPVPASADDAGRCRDTAFSGDSRDVFAFCDFSGEFEIWRFAANGIGQPKQITEGAAVLRRSLSPSPDGRWIAHTDKEGRLFLSDLKNPARAAATREVDHDALGDGAATLNWSADGKSLAFVRTTANPYREQLMLLTVADGKVHQLGSDRYAATAPAFSPDGQWLYFLSRRTFSVTGNPGPWGDRNMGPYFDKGWKIYAIALQPNLRFPFAAPDELQGMKAKEEAEIREQEKDKPDNKESKQKVEGAKADAAKEAKPAASAAKSGKPDIQIAGLALRLYEVPAAAGNYSGLAVDSKRLYVQEGSALRQLPIGPQESKLETFADGVAAWDLSADGKKLMIRRSAAPGTAPEILIVDAGPKLPGDLDKSRVRWSDWQIAVDPKAEWRQMFNDAWRMQRDFFYDKDMHGVDWAAMRAKYFPLTERVTERGELAELMAQMVGELSLLHSQVAPGELRKGVEEPGYAGLGAQLERDAKGTGWKIVRIFAGDPELPSEAGPLAAPGLNIAEGAVITQINGRKALSVPDPSELMRGQAGKQVLLQIREPSGKERPVVVTPVDVRRESQLRVNDWRFSRARLVDKAAAPARDDPRRHRRFRPGVLRAERARGPDHRRPPQQRRQHRQLDPADALAPRLGLLATALAVREQALPEHAAGVPRQGRRDRQRGNLLRRRNLLRRLQAPGAGSCHRQDHLGRRRVAVRSEPPDGQRADALSRERTDHRRRAVPRRGQGRDARHRGRQPATGDRQWAGCTARCRHRMAEGRDREGSDQDAEAGTVSAADQAVTCTNKNGRPWPPVFRWRGAFSSA